MLDVDRVPDLLRRSIESTDLKDQGLATLVLTSYSRRLLIAAGLPTLLEALRRPAAAFAAANWLSGCGEHARPALAPLIDMLNDPDPMVCKNALYALGEIGLAEPEVLAALHAAREHPDPRVQEEAREALITIRRGPRRTAD